MNTPLFILSSPTSVVVYLELESGGPATGLTFADVTAGIKKDGSGSFSVFTLTGLNFTELSDGFYEVALEASDTDTLGSLYLSFTGATIVHALLAGFVTTVASSPTPAPPLAPLITTIFGYIFDSGGNPVEGASVVARVVQQPTIIQTATDAIVIGSDFLTALSDETGFFSIDVLTGARVEFIITDANYRRTVTIPGSTTNLFDIP